jgi:hypothetical protein
LLVAPAAAALASASTVSRLGYACTATDCSLCVAEVLPVTVLHVVAGSAQSKELGNLMHCLRS